MFPTATGHAFSSNVVLSQPAQRSHITPLSLRLFRKGACVDISTVQQDVGKGDHVIDLWGVVSSVYVSLRPATIGVHSSVKKCSGAEH